MAYMNADTGNKVGFRPYGGTNPQCAAQLSGLGQNHPFKPEAWMLHPDESWLVPPPPPAHALGDYEFNRPFDPWELYEAHSGLHGLAGLGAGEECVYLAADGVTVESLDPNSSLAECGANGGIWEVPPAADAAPVPVAVAAPAPTAGVPAGSSLTYKCTFTATANPLSASFYSVSNVIAAVASALQGQWGVSVSSSTGSGTLVGTPSATLQVLANNAYGSVADLKSVIDGAFYNAAGASVTSSSLTLNSTPQVQSTLIQRLAIAQATGDTTTANALMSLINSGGGAGTPMTALESWITGNALWIALGVGGLLIAPQLIGGLTGRRR